LGLPLSGRVEPDGGTKLSDITSNAARRAAAGTGIFNCRDFLPGAARFGVEVLLPGDALRRVTA